MDKLPSPTRRALLGAGLGSLALAAGCSDRGGFFALPGRGGPVLQGLTMGTSYTVKLGSARLSDARLAQAEQAVASALGSVVAQMSHYEPDSELAQLNRQPLGVPLNVSASTLQVFGVAESVYRASGGLFDVALGRAVDEWGFGPAGKPRRVPGAQALQALRQERHAGALRLDTAAGRITRQAPVQANLSGIAKGYGVDRAALALDALGLADYMVEAGGEIRTHGLNPDGKPWQLAIEQPDAMPQRAWFVLPLSGLSLATSGDYRNFFVQDGRRYCHEIDPVDATPTQHGLASVSVVASDCTVADAWSTALFVAGPERGLALAAQQGLAAYFIVRAADGRFESRQTAAFAALGGRSVA
jgi:thiamine biosynthesis lipoprotein